MTYSTPRRTQEDSMSVLLKQKKKITHLSAYNRINNKSNIEEGREERKEYRG